MGKGERSKPNWSRALSVAPQRGVKRLHSLLSSEQPSNQTSGAFNRTCAAENQRWQSCFEEVAVPANENRTFYFWMANIQRVLETVANEVQWFRRLLQEEFDDHLKLLLTTDECTGGNVLVTSSSKKITFWYFAIVNLGELHRSSVLLPFACIPARDLSEHCGVGQSGATCALLKNLQEQRLDDGFQLLGRRFRASIHCFLADYEAVRTVFATRGAAGLKCCCLCQNVLAKGRVEAERDASFVTIACDDAQRFQPYDVAQLFAFYDTTLSSPMTITRRKELETLFGFSLDERCLLANRGLRGMLNLNHIYLDACHCYYANGIAAQELVLMVNFMSQEYNWTLKDLQTSVMEVSWQCKEFVGPRSRWWLFHETYWIGNMFKGSATQVSYLLPLVHHYAFLLVTDKSKLEWQCFDSLVDCHMILKRLRVNRCASDINVLALAQRKHHRLFCQCYANLVRPKHHLRLHLPELIHKFGCYADCFPAEAKHQLYKGFLADSHGCLSQLGTGKQSKALLGKLLARCVNDMQTNAWTDGMVGKIYSEDEVQAYLPDVKARVSAGYQVGALVIKTGDVLCWGTQAGLVQFWAVQDDIPVLIFEPLRRTKQIHRYAVLWTRTQDKDSVRVSDLKDLRVPAWRLDEHQTILVLD